MDINRLHNDIENGVIWRDMKRYKLLGCNEDSIYTIIAAEYNTTKENSKTICEREAAKHTHKQTQQTPRQQQNKRKTEDRNLKIKFRFFDLYEKDRLRLDDAILQCSEEFFLSEAKVVEIIRGAVASGEMELTTSSIISRFNKPHRKDKENKYLQAQVIRLKEQYEQTANKE